MTNRLADETSPYLRQHADNPVDWMPWGDEALNAAREAGKPILLSIGYSSCHWCHVMAAESFEDPRTAEVMNNHFVNIKVDREERPDLDKVYQLAHQVITQNGGGWPLTMFLDPDTLVPFFGGTYFPKTPRYGLPGFADLLMRISATFDEKSEELAEQGEKVQAVLDAMKLTATEAEHRDADVLAAARTGLGRQYDGEHGGFGTEPKFPMPTAIERVLRHWAYQDHPDVKAAERDREGLDMVMHTLTQMARGGIYDHVGGGFCRYSTDRRWRIPHFEKMLYDNGQLLALYADALRVGPDALFEGVLEETVQWLLTEMRHPGGAFYAALDADSEGREGAYYVWQRHEIKKLLDEEEYLLVETLYGLDKPANFENRWNLYRTDSWRSVVSRLMLEDENPEKLLARAKAKLKAAREERPRPGCDDKILTSWNGLAIKGLACAAQVMQRRDWLTAGQAAADFLREHVWAEGRLYATYQGEAKFPGYLDDYAYLLDGLLALLSAEWRDTDLSFARALADGAIEAFEDAENGGFFFTAAQHESLIHRPKPTTDDALPPGNGVLARALIELSHLTGESRYLDAAERTLKWARAFLEKHPMGHCSLLAALEDVMHPPELVIVRGPLQAIGEWQRVAAKDYKPWRRVYAIPYENVRHAPPYLPRLVSAEAQQAPQAFICTGTSCSLPIESLAELRKIVAPSNVLSLV